MTESQKERYKRHLMLEDVGEEGQERLLRASVLVIGAGGLGSPNCFYLAAAGIGRIGILDFDIIELNNLQRQIIHTTQEIHSSKVKSAERKMLALNPEVQVETHFEKLTATNALHLVQDYDFIIDATDNFASKFLINDACILASKPLSHAGIFKHHGQTITILPKKSACFACVFDKPPSVELNSVFKAGLFGVVPGVVGCIQASEAIKYFLGFPLLTNQLLHVDTKSMDFRKINVQRNAECRVCGAHGIENLTDYPQ
ncbi:Thiamin biosynthesis protein ThiF [Helicobacter sp. NHP19-012]|uniref:Thiamin biosynthesis protein ThiF n=1 Tax=Helicobacter gastrofelis TaxID=2849642 RepID=A0ABM7SEW2_9HELI|nr:MULTISPECIES: HesA/MoeB/ThiF family protein [unclassified Helicobacter]BCZ19336.1 Thiamin biosynthesis protein ThiF [Helicobacter sp. NHP19-012]GMB96107.1 Thiamin biosynthesis protein ThiF [Helicobacter sp. NHP22-001]